VSLGRATAFGREPLLQLFGERDLRDLAVAERGGLTNSLAAVAFGSDLSQQVDTRAAGIALRRSPVDPFSLRIAYETDAPVRRRAPCTARSSRRFHRGGCAACAPNCTAPADGSPATHAPRVGCGR
jgi:hypothetical protein